jgi:hypothetical protein
MIPLLTGPQDPSQLQSALNSLITQLNSSSGLGLTARFTAPIAAELISIKAAATPANGAITIAAQPDYPRKLQVRVVLGTPGTTNITAGTLTLVGTNAAGQTVTEVVSLVTAVTVTLQSANAYAQLTSGTVAGYVASGSGTGNTLGLGVSAQLGLPLPAGFSVLNVFKENVDNANEAVGTIDYVAGTVSPTTAPNASHNFDFWYSVNSAE